MPENQTTIYTYTAWDGYEWFGLNPELAQKLEDAKNSILPCLDDFQTKGIYGGLINIIHDGEKFVVAIRCHSRKNGDKHFRDSLYLSVAVIPQSNLIKQPLDFEKLFKSKEMELIQEGEPQPLVIDNAKLIRLIPVNKVPVPLPLIIEEETIDPFLKLTNLYQSPSLSLAEIKTTLEKNETGYHLKISASFPKELSEYIASKGLLLCNKNELQNFTLVASYLKSSLLRDPYPSLTTFCHSEAKEILFLIQKLKAVSDDFGLDEIMAPKPEPPPPQAQQKAEYSETEKLCYEIQKLKNENTHLKRLLNEYEEHEQSTPPTKTKTSTLLLLAIIVLALLLIAIILR